jgi:hypothetical protein
MSCNPSYWELSEFEDGLGSGEFGSNHVVVSAMLVSKLVTTT